MNEGLGERFARLAKDLSRALDEEERILRRGDVASLGEIQQRKEPVMRGLERLAQAGNNAETTRMRELFERQRANAGLLREAMEANRTERNALGAHRRRLRGVQHRYRSRGHKPGQLRASA